MKPSGLSLLCLIACLATVSCSKDKDDKPNAIQTENQKLALREEIGNDPFEINGMISEAVALLEADKIAEAKKKMKIVEKYRRAKSGYCTIRDTGSREATYLIAIVADNREVERGDINKEDFVLFAAGNFESAWTKILEFKKAGLCKNAGPCIKSVDDFRKDPVLKIPVYGSDARIFYSDSDREQFLRMAQSVGLCI